MTPQCLTPAFFVILSALLLGACDRPTPKPVDAPSQDEPELIEQAPAPVLVGGLTPVITSERVVAIGDVHGDLSALKRTLRLAGLTNEQGAWTGGEAVMVQTGDVLDRGDDEQEIIDYLDALGLEASAAGGQIIELLGNHETMNVAGDMRYATPKGFEDFADAPGVDMESGDERVKSFPMPARARIMAFRPKGPYAMKLAQHKVVAVVNDSMFVHGGILPQHVTYGLDRLNDEVSQWMRGEARNPKEVTSSENSPLWTRQFSGPDTSVHCDELTGMLKGLGLKRLVVGHTPQLNGITQECDGQVWRVDVGMSAHYGGAPGALEITQGEVRVLSDAPAPVAPVVDAPTVDAPK